MSRCGAADVKILLDGFYWARETLGLCAECDEGRLALAMFVVVKLDLNMMSSYIDLSQSNDISWICGKC